MSTGNSIALLLAQQVKTFTQSEKRIAKVIQTDYPMTALTTIARLAERSHVSDATVLRFIRRLGFQGYPEFQNAVKQDLEESLQTPISLASCRPPEDWLNTFNATLSENLSQTFKSLHMAEIAAVDELLAPKKRKAFIIGGNYSASAASHLFFQLHRIRENVFLMSDVLENSAPRVLDWNKSCVIFIFDVRRYSKKMYNLAEIAAQQGARIVLFCDQWISPISRFAAITFPCKVNSPSPWDSLVALSAVVEMLAHYISEKNMASMKRRLSKLEDIQKRQETEQSGKGSFSQG